MATMSTRIWARLWSDRNIGLKGSWKSQGNFVVGEAGHPVFTECLFPVQNLFQLQIKCHQILQM